LQLCEEGREIGKEGRTGDCDLHVHSALAARPHAALGVVQEEQTEDSEAI
jgi:hypothetical protein